MKKWFVSLESLQEIDNLLYLLIGLLVLNACSSATNGNSLHKGQPYKECHKEESPQDTFLVEYCKEFNADSICAREGGYINSKPYSWHKFYDATGIKEREEEYNLLANDSVELNQIIKFNRNGDTLFDESNFYYIKYNKRTLAVGDTLLVDIILRAPYFRSDTISIFLDDPDVPNLEHRLYSHNNRKRFTYVAKKAGKYFVPGVLRETHREGNKEQTRDMIFELKFKVE